MTRKGNGRQEEKGYMRLQETWSVPLGLCAHARGGGIVVDEKHTGIVVWYFHKNSRQGLFVSMHLHF